MTNEEFYKQYHKQQKVVQEALSNRPKIKNIKDFLPEGISYLKVIPSVTQDPKDSFVTIYYHGKILRVSEEALLENPNRGRSGIVCLDAMAGNSLGTNCQVCSLINNPSIPEHVAKALVKHYLYRCVYFNAIPVLEGSQPKFEEEDSKSNPVFIASVYAEPVINKINRYLGLPGGVDNSGNLQPPFPESEQNLFAESLHPTKGSTLMFEKKSTVVKIGGKSQTRVNLQMSIGNVKFALTKDMIESASDLTKFNKVPDYSAVKSALEELFPSEMVNG